MRQIKHRAGLPSLRSVVGSMKNIEGHHVGYCRHQGSSCSHHVGCYTTRACARIFACLPEGPNTQVEGIYPRA